MKLDINSAVFQLRDILKEKEHAIAEKERRIAQLLDYIMLQRKRQFAPSADRPNKDQFTLFHEAELEQLMADLDTPEPVNAKPTTQEKTERKPKQPVRRALPAYLKRVERIIDLCDEDRAAMGED